MSKRSRRGLLPVVVTLGILVTFGGPFVSRRFLKTSDLVVAVLDTGVNPASTELHGHLMLTARAQTGDTTDADGHGTRIAETILRAASGAKGQGKQIMILPIKVTGNGLGIEPGALGEAVNYAVSQGAKVINFSIGLTHSDAVLEKAIRDASKAGVILISASGIGIENIFRPVPLSQIYPQAYQAMIVVGMVIPLGGPEKKGFRPDPVSNFGPELDLAVPSLNESRTNQKYYGSSYSAAQVSGWVAGYLARQRFWTPQIKPETLRAALRAAASEIKVGLECDPDHCGYGVLEENPFLKSSSETMNLVELSAHRIFGANGARNTTWLALDLNSAKSILSTDVELICGTVKVGGTGWTENPHPFKGRARIDLQELFKKSPCAGPNHIKVKVKTPSKNQAVLEVSPGVKF